MGFVNILIPQALNSMCVLESLALSVLVNYTFLSHTEIAQEISFVLKHVRGYAIMLSTPIVTWRQNIIFQVAPHFVFRNKILSSLYDGCFDSSDFKSVMATSQAFMVIVRMSLLAVMEASYFFHQSIELLTQVFKGKHVE